MSTNVSAMQRWLLTAHDRAAMTNHCRDLAGVVGGKSTAHKEATPNRVKRDEEDVQNLMMTTSNWMNSFTTAEENICSLSCGTVATSDIEADLMSAYRKGWEACEKFVESRLVNQTTHFHDSLPNMELSTLKSTAVKRR